MTASAVQSDINRSTGQWLERPLVASLLLLATYGALSLLVHDKGSLGTDTGAKLATLGVMAEENRWHPDVGYWAEQWDPTGSYHPLFSSLPAEGKWIAVSTLPMLLLAYPLFELGGVSLALLLPMVGGVAAALAIRRIVGSLGGPPTAAFWLAGLATPITIYSLDFWEHTVGLALMLWGIAVTLRWFERPSLSAGFANGAIGGLLFGAAASMRTEALVYAAVLVSVAFVVLALDRRPVFLVFGSTGAFAIAFAAMLVANAALERVVLGSMIRAGRSAGTAAVALQDGELRVREALATSFDMTASGGYGKFTIGLGVVLTAALVALVVLARRGVADWPVRLGVLAVTTYLIRSLTQGIGFVSGLFPANPIAAAGLAPAKLDKKLRFVLLVALAAAPLVWATGYVGGAGPQWGGRYILLTSSLFFCAGVVSLTSIPKSGQRFFAALSITITMLGFTWLVQRSYGVEEWRQNIFATQDGAYISSQPFLLREFGTHYSPERRWLSLTDPRAPQPAADIMAAAGIERFEFITVEDPDKSESDPVIAGWERVGERKAAGLAELTLIEYRRLPPP